MDLSISKTATKLMYTSSEDNYTLTDLDYYQTNQQTRSKEDVHHYRSSSNEYDARSNISRSSTPASCLPTEEPFNEDSNDSTTRKRRKNPVNSRAKKSKLIKDVETKNAKQVQEETNEMKSLSQQLEDATIETKNDELDDSKFEFYDEKREYFSNISTTNISTTSYTGLKNSKSSKSTRPVESPSMNASLIEPVDSTSEPLNKSIAFGPMPKSSNKKPRRKSTQKNNLIRKPPIPRKLKIFESFTATEPDDQNIGKSKQQTNSEVDKKQQQQKKASPPKQEKQIERRPTSVSSDDSKDLKKEKRRLSNNDSARLYRRRVKEKYVEIDRKIIALQDRYNTLRNELRKVLTQKHSLVNMILAMNNKKEIELPDWMNDPDLKLLI